MNVDILKSSDWLWYQAHISLIQVLIHLSYNKGWKNKREKRKQRDYYLAIASVYRKQIIKNGVVSTWIGLPVWLYVQAVGVRLTAE